MKHFASQVQFSGIGDNTEFTIERPLIRWAGGKSWIVKEVSELLQKAGAVKNYYEPFFGGGAVFFNLIQSRYKSYLNDLNPELMLFYRMLKERPNELYSRIIKLPASKEDYYRVRSSKPRSDLNKASRFYYLNQNSFNGIYRVNKLGNYNVPYGNRVKNVVPKEKFLRWSYKLQRAKIDVGDFQLYARRAGKGDMFFLDPPYTVSHNRNGFIKYNEKLFSVDDQMRLKQFIDVLHQKGANFILTNASHDFVRSLFCIDYFSKDVTRTSVVGGKQAKRGLTEEIIITNIVSK